MSRAIFIFAILLLANSLEATCGYYAGGAAGTAFIDDHVENYDFNFKLGTTATVMAGYAPASNWRFELRGGYLYSTTCDIKLRGGSTAIEGRIEILSSTLSLITLLPFSNTLALSTGLGMGAKYERLKLHGTNLPPIKFYETDFLYEILIGLNHMLNNQWEIALEYHLNNPDADLKGHLLNLNVRHFF